MVIARNQTTSLWALVEAMQRRLEREGLEAPAVDAEVARGLQSLLYRDMFASARQARRLSKSSGGPQLRGS
jgi:hypothetical protein